MIFDLCFLNVCVIFNLVAINTLPYTFNMKDIGHETFPLIPRKYSFINDINLTLQLVLFMSFSDWNIIRRLLFSISIFYFIRACTVHLTIAPSIKHYTEKINYLGIFGAINDLLPFSGHMGLGTLMLYYSPFFYLYLVLNILLGYFIIALRNHYTIEVVLSWLFCPLLAYYLDSIKIV